MLQMPLSGLCVCSTSRIMPKSVCFASPCKIFILSFVLCMDMAACFTKTQCDAEQITFAPFEHHTHSNAHNSAHIIIHHRHSPARLHVSATSSSAPLAHRRLWFPVPRMGVGSLGWGVVSEIGMPSKE